MFLGRLDRRIRQVETVQVNRQMPIISVSADRSRDTSESAGTLLVRVLGSSNPELTHHYWGPIIVDGLVWNTDLFKVLGVFLMASSGFFLPSWLLTLLLTVLQSLSHTPLNVRALMGLFSFRVCTHH